MTDVPATMPQQAEERKRSSPREMVAATEIDLRLFGMVVALLAIVLGFGVLTNGRYLEPANLITLSVQAAGVAVMATGMVLVIVTRNIDLSVGSIVGVVGDVLRAADDRDPARLHPARAPADVGHRAGVGLAHRGD